MFYEDSSIEDMAKKIASPAFLESSLVKKVEAVDIEQQMRRATSNSGIRGQTYTNPYIEHQKKMASWQHRLSAISNQPEIKTQDEVFQPFTGVF